MSENEASRYLGKYVILERIGRGGMAEVYKAYHPALDRYVAIKLLHPFLADDPEFKNRFEHEAQNVAKLRHPNIVQVYDFEFDEENESYYMVMELVNGPTLKDVLFDLAREDGRLSLEESVRIGCDIGQALAYAHSRGMIHRDVKPANIMQDTQDQRYVLTDFGIAKIVTGPHYTTTGGMIGTPAYMSPEQALGEPGDERADIYSLGVILFQLCTGRLPFDADTALALVLKHVNEPVPSPSALNPDLPEGLEKIICRAMAKDPADRFLTAQDMVDQLSDLDRAATMAMPLTVNDTHPALRGDVLGVAGDSTPLAQSSELRAPPRRPRWVGLVVFALLVLIVGLGAFAVVPGLLGEATPTPPAPTATSTTDLTATVERATLQAFYDSFATQTAVAALITQTPTPTATATLTPPATSTHTPSPTATDTLTSTASPTYVPAQAVLEHPDAVRYVCFSPGGGRRVLTAGADGLVRLWETETGARVRAYEGHTGPVNAALFSPVAPQIASAGADGTVRLWDEQSGELLRTLRGHRGEVTALAFNLYATRMASSGEDGVVRLWEPDTGRLVAALRGHEGPITDIAFSRDGTVLASAGADGTIRLWRADTGAMLALMEGHEGPVTDIAFSPPDGEILASAGADGSIRLWDGLTGELLVAFGGHAGPINRLAYSPTGGMIGSASDDGTVRLWNAATGEFVAALQRHNGPVRLVAFSPDDNRLVTAGADGMLYLWNRQASAWLATLSGHAAAINAVTFSRDGTLLASASEDGDARLWHIPDAVPVIIQPTRPPSPTPTPVFSPTPNMTATVAACDYDYELVARTYQPAYELIPGQFYIRVRAPFTTTLTVRNTGNCDWERYTALVHVEGETYGLAGDVLIPNNTRVGAEYTFTLDMTAPRRNIPHTGIWELRTPGGFLIGDPIEITIHAYTDSSLGSPGSAQVTATSPGDAGGPLEFSFYIPACSYAGQDFVCDVAVYPTGGTPPYTVRTDAGATTSSEPYVVQVRGRRCLSFGYTLYVTDSAGGITRQERWFDVNGYSSAFPDGNCTLGG